MSVVTKRVYELRDSDRGYRVLVDRIWPRGRKKDELALDEWRKDLAPSPELRKWFAHDPKRWDEFRRRFRCELEDKREEIDRLRRIARRRRLLLLYSARDRDHNQAVVLKDVIGGGMASNKVKS